jgi:hypothetical protein
MESLLFEVLAAAANRSSIDVRHGLEQGGIELDRMIGFGQCEFRNRGIE